MLRTVTAPDTAIASEAALGPLPEWDLSDLYPGRDSPELRRDLTNLATHAKIFRERYEKKLAGLSGADFDRAYLEHEIAFHTNAIQAVRATLIPSTANPELRQFMTDVLPGFQHHLDETVRIAKSLGYH